MPGQRAVARTSMFRMRGEQLRPRALVRAELAGLTRIPVVIDELPVVHRTVAVPRRLVVRVLAQRRIDFAVVEHADRMTELVHDSELDDFISERGVPSKVSELVRSHGGVDTLSVEDLANLLEVLLRVLACLRARIPDQTRKEQRSGEDVGGDHANPVDKGEAFGKAPRLTSDPSAGAGSFESRSTLPM